MNKSDILSIGSGAYFPIELTTNDKGEITWSMVDGDVKLINQNIIAIFNTQIGNILRNEDFGTRLWECLEEPNTQALEFLIYRFCKSAIDTWEPRVIFVDAYSQRSSDKIHINLKYKVNTDQLVKDLNFSYNTNTKTFSL